MILNDFRLHRKMRFVFLLTVMVGIGMLSQRVVAQNYTCFPSCIGNDSRMLAIAGSGISTMVGGTIVIGIGVPSNASSFEIGIFDGETGGKWDIGTTALEYTLYADPNGDGTGSTQVNQWSGSSMTDNAWHTLTVSTGTSAQATSGNYLYVLRVRITDSTTATSSAFKVRTTGTISVKPEQAFHVINPLPNNATATEVYPAFPTLTPTTYDGTWKVYIEMPGRVSSLSVWDGDADHGNYSGTVKDSDDPNTPNSSVPSWATGTEAVAEGVAKGNPATDAANVPNGDTATSAPADDERRAVFARSPSIVYSITDPVGNVYTNNNPSGNKEWEEFKISTAGFDSTQMDHHADSLVAGTYVLTISGMDLANLNAWRFFQQVGGQEEVLGVDSAGAPVGPKRPYRIHGKLYHDNDSNGVQGSGEPGIPSVTVNLEADRNNDGTIDAKYSVETDANGAFSFENLHGGTYKVKVDPATLDEQVNPTSDPDGTGTPHQVTITRSSSSSTNTSSIDFGYKRTPQPPSNVGTRTRGYWVNHEENWPVSSLTLGGVSYSKAQLLTILRKPTKGDKSYIIAAQLIATKLNLANGTEASCISDYVEDAGAWLTSHPIGSKPNNAAWAVGGSIADELDSYNNGNECAPHMD